VARTLPVTLATLAAQTVRDHEVVVVDDGSTDATGHIARAWAARDERIRVIGLGGGGIVGALNAGLECCRAPVVARIDGDDLAVPHRLARQLELLADPSLTAVDGRVRFFSDQGEVGEGMRRYGEWVNRIVDPEDFDRELLVECPIVHPAVTFRRDAILRAGGYRAGDFPEDYELWLRLHAQGHRFRKVPEVLCYQRDRPERLTRTHPSYGRAAFRKARQLWLARTVLAAPRRVVLWGGGKEGRPWLAWLRQRGHRVVAVVDVDPRKLGRLRHGEVPVVPPVALAELDVEILLVAVAARGARKIIRNRLGEVRPDWREGKDWWAVR